MSHAKPLLATLFVGIVFSSIFWVLLASSLPGRTVPASPPSISTGTAPVDPAPDLPISLFPNDLALSTAFSAAVTFGPTKIVTSSTTISSGTNLAQELGRELALAMDIMNTDIESATLMCDGGICTDPVAVAVMGLAPGTWFPTRGKYFALLSTGTVTELPSTDVYQAVVPRPGVAEVAQPPELEVLHGMKNTENGDLVGLHLELSVPLTATCMALDYSFYTVDLPYTNTGSLTAAVSAPSGDVFTAQITKAELRLENGTVFAPGNIAFNARGEVVASSTMSPSEIYAALRGPTSSNIPGVFPLLQMRQVVTGGELLNLNLSIQDLGDAFADSAVALDNFSWLANTDPADCRPKPGHSGDRDGDGLPDGWEQYGTVQSDGHALQYLDLKSWGADPDTKDVFVEVDAMQPLTPGGYDPRPRPEAIARIVAAFACAPVEQLDGSEHKSPHGCNGIHLHVDYGPDAPLDWADAGGDKRLKWDRSAGGNTLATDSKERLCGTECANSLDWLWKTFDAIKDDNFSPARAPVFHYALFAHRLADCTGAMMASSLVFCGDNGQISGISKNLLPTVHGASDFVVTLGAPDWTDAYATPILPQAGTFMHELGHNLGLNHYGTIESQDPLHIMNKPNHLSVMNYLYQTSGLVVSDTNFLFDYSRYNMAPLSETEMWETKGISMEASHINVTYTLGVRYFCQSQKVRVDDDAHQVNWDCDSSGIIQTAPVKANITGDIDDDDNRKYSELVVTNEWDQLVFTGGMLNRQRSMLQPLIAVRMRAPAISEGVKELAPDAAGTSLSPRLLILQEPIRIPAANELIRQELTIKQNNLIPQEGTLIPGWKDFRLLPPVIPTP